MTEGIVSAGQYYRGYYIMPHAAVQAAGDQLMPTILGHVQPGTLTLHAKPALISMLQGHMQQNSSSAAIRPMPAHGMLHAIQACANLRASQYPYIPRAQPLSGLPPPPTDGYQCAAAMPVPPVPQQPAP